MTRSQFLEVIQKLFNNNNNNNKNLLRASRTRDLPGPQWWPYEKTQIINQFNTTGDREARRQAGHQ